MTSASQQCIKCWHVVHTLRSGHVHVISSSIDIFKATCQAFGRTGLNLGEPFTAMVGHVPLWLPAPTCARCMWQRGCFLHIHSYTYTWDLPSFFNLEVDKKTRTLPRWYYGALGALCQGHHDTVWKADMGCTLHVHARLHNLHLISFFPVYRSNTLSHRDWWAACHHGSASAIVFCRAELCKVHVREGALNMRGILLVDIFFN